MPAEQDTPAAEDQTTQENPLTALKREIKEITDEGFKFIWQQVEERMKQSYRNGIEAGKKQAQGNGAKPAQSAGARREWKRRASSEES